jgi:hypothetical protein
VQEVELAVREYDSELTERHQELMHEQAAYDDLCARMKVCIHIMTLECPDNF